MTADLASTLVTVWVATGIAGGVVAILALLVRASPRPIRDRAVAEVTRWNEVMLGFFPRFAYAMAVVMVLSFALLLVGAIALLFVPR